MRLWGKRNARRRGGAIGDREKPVFFEKSPGKLVL
jgi:hypothetical protein